MHALLGPMVRVQDRNAQAGWGEGEGEGGGGSLDRPTLLHDSGHSVHTLYQLKLNQ